LVAHRGSRSRVDPSLIGRRRPARRSDPRRHRSRARLSSNWPSGGEIEHCEVRELIVRPFRIVYRVRPDSIEIVAIFHSSRLPPWTSE